MEDKKIGGGKPPVRRDIELAIANLERISADYDELQRRAAHFFPLIELDKFRGEECHLPPGTLVFLEPFDLRQSYVDAFCAENVLRDEKGMAIPVKIKSEVACFDCYHKKKDRPFALLSPSADEVLSQIPKSINWQEGYFAFVIEFDGVSNVDFYYPDYGVYRTKVHLYQLKGKLPKELERQPIIIDWQTIETNRGEHA